MPARWRASNVVPDEALGSRTDARLVVAMASAEVEALAEAYDRHGEFVYGLGLRLCGQQQAAALTQEVFLALWCSPAEFLKPAGSLRAVLVADMYHRAAMFLQSERSHHPGLSLAPRAREPELGESADQGKDRLA